MIKSNQYENMSNVIIVQIYIIYVKHLHSVRCINWLSITNIALKQNK